MRQDRDGGTWRGVDERTDQPVSILILSAEHPHLADVVDAALRTTDLDDPRLVRIVAAGREPVSFVVTERVVGRDLPRLLADGPLPAESARRVIGETALALVTASRSGLHHLRLGPRSVVVRPDGRVVLNGLAINAAAVGIEEPDADLAERADAVGLVRLLYATLTCRWPGAAVAGLPAAPRVGGRPVAPGDLVAGVPADLDALCVQTLAGGGGPETPAEVVERLGTWDRNGRLDAWLALDTELPPLRPSAPDAPTAARPRTTADASGPDPDGEGPTERATPSDVSGGQDGTTPAPAAHRPPPDLTDAATLAALAGLPADVTAEIPATRRTDALGGLPPEASLVPLGTLPTQHVGPPATPITGTPAASDGAGDGPDDGTGHGPHLPSPALALAEVLTEREPLGELLPAEPSLPRDQTRILLAVVAAFLLVGFVFAVQTVAELGRNSASLFEEDRGAVLIPTPTPTVKKPATSPSPSAAASPSKPRVKPAAGPAPSVAGIQAVDPQGDGEENGGRATRAIDDDRGTSWRSARYNSPEFGGLKKGLGLVVELKKKAPVRAVSVRVAGSDGTMQVRLGSSPDVSEAKKVGSSPIDGGKAKVTLDEAREARYVILWFTRLPRADGEYRLDVSEIEVR